MVFDKELLQAFVRHEVHRRSDGITDLMIDVSQRLSHGLKGVVSLKARHTHVQTKTRPETEEPALLDDLLRRSDGPFALVVVTHGVVAPGRVLFRHQSGVLCRVLHQLEGTCSFMSLGSVIDWTISNYRR